MLNSNFDLKIIGQDFFPAAPFFKKAVITARKKTPSCGQTIQQQSTVTACKERGACKSCVEDGKVV